MMRFFLLAAIATSVTITIARFVPAQGEPKPKAESKTQSKEKQEAIPDKPTAELSADQNAIHDNIVAFVKAYNKGDAKAIAALFAKEAQIITEDGETVEGREAIAKAFEHIFTNSPEVQMEVFLDSIRLIGNDLAVEVGSTKETSAPGKLQNMGVTRFCTSNATANG